MAVVFAVVLYSVAELLPHMCVAIYVFDVVQLLKLLEQFPDVVFIKVNFDDNKAMCKTLGVKVGTLHGWLALAAVGNLVLQC